MTEKECGTRGDGKEGSENENAEWSGIERIRGVGDGGVGYDHSGAGVGNGDADGGGARNTGYRRGAAT